MRNEDTGKDGTFGEPVSPAETTGSPDVAPGWSGIVVYPVSLLDYFI